MKIVIIGAMSEEIAFLKEKLNNLQQKQINKFTFFEGDLYDKEIIIVESGIGKVMAGVLIATIVNNYPEIDKIINVGVAGGIGDLQIGDIVVGENCVYGDADISVFSEEYRYGQMARCPFLFPADQELLLLMKDLQPTFATICTTDKFMVDIEFIKDLINKYYNDVNIRCFDMESAAFAQTCYFYGIDFVAIRAISDVIGSDDQDTSFYDNLQHAALNSNYFVLELLKKLTI